MLFTLERKGVLTVPRNLLFLFIGIFFGYVKIMSIFFKSFDPFIPFENLSSAVFFGGLIDAFRKAQKPAAKDPKNKDTTSELTKMSSTEGESKKSL
jgi:hypothetical protein